MQDNPLLKLETFGQSVWLDFLSRDLMNSGGLQQLIDQDGLRGVTSNPAIFKKAMAGAETYDDDIRRLVAAGKSVEEIYEALTVADVCRAATLLHPVYEANAGGAGFVSLEVSPHLAHDTQGTIEEARRLWAAVDQPNLMVKVPGTRAGLPAIQQLLSEGINVNVTLLFSLERYRQVVDAYFSGLETRLEQGLPVEHVASVASFFLSRIDVLLDPRLEGFMELGGPRGAFAKSVRGKIGIASAKSAYQIYQSLVAGERFQTLAAQGVRPQRLLWASTGTKNPEYSDVMYVEALIGPDTINTMPLDTLEAYRDHGDPAARLTEGVESAHRILEHLPDVDIDLDQATHQLEEEGVQKFIDPYNETMKGLAEKYKQFQEVVVSS